MVDVTEDFLVKAKSYLGEEGKRVRNYFCCGLQDFSPEPDSYDVIWIQWVIGERPAAARLLGPVCLPPVETGVPWVPPACPALPGPWGPPPGKCLSLHVGLTQYPLQPAAGGRFLLKNLHDG